MRRSCFVSSGKKDRADTLFLSSLSSINHAQEFSFLIYFPSVQQTRLARRLSVSSSVCLSFSFLCSVCLSRHRESVFSLRWCDKHLNSTPKTDKKAKNWSKASRSAWQKKKKPKKTGRYHERAVHINETWCLPHEYSNSEGFDQTLTLSLAFPFVHSLSFLWSLPYQIFSPIVVLNATQTVIRLFMNNLRYRTELRTSHKRLGGHRD